MLHAHSREGKSLQQTAHCIHINGPKQFNAVYDCTAFQSSTKKTDLDETPFEAADEACFLQ